MPDTELALQMKALGDPTRLQIIALLPNTCLVTSSFYAKMPARGNIEIAVNMFACNVAQASEDL